MKNRTKNKIEFFLFIMFIKIFKLFPYKITEKFLCNVVKFGGTVLKLRYEVAYNNLKKVFPLKTNRELKVLISKMYEDMGKTAAETYFADNNEIINNANIIGYENIEDALSEGKGAILATLHMGNWELAGICLARRTKTSVVIKKQRNRYFDKYTNKLRERENIVLIDKKNALRHIIKLLKDNYVVAILMDQNAGKSGIETDFLGYPASTFVGTAKIAIKQKCPIIPAVSYRDDKGKNILIMEKAINTENIDNNQEAIKELTERVSKQLEKYILENPEQWFWVHKRWKGASRAKKV